MKYASVWSVVNLVFFLCVSLTRAVPKDSEKGLYGPGDNVLILDKNTLSKTVENNPKAIVVEFYAHWCPHCQKFASTWKKFAKNVYEWREVVIIAVIDCGDPTNEQLCVDYGVPGYPTIRYFAPKSPPKSKGDDIQRGEGDPVDLIVLSLTQALEKTAAAGKGGASWPNLKVTENLSQALTQLPPAVKFVAVVFDKLNSSAGTALILDFYGVKEVLILRVLDTNKEAVTKYGVKDFPSLYVQQRGSTELTLLPTDSKDRKDFYKALKKRISK